MVMYAGDKHSGFQQLSLGGAQGTKILRLQHRTLGTEGWSSTYSEDCIVCRVGVSAETHQECEGAPDRPQCNSAGARWLSSVFACCSRLRCLQHSGEVMEDIKPCFEKRESCQYVTIDLSSDMVNFLRVFCSS
jgi:hypothetical protein